MLFIPTEALESEKERNFYYKVFAGYFFNELVPGHERRLERFTKALYKKHKSTFSGPLDEDFTLSPKTTHVTFDFHGYLLDEGNDRGELADILITDLENNSAAAVEVKFLSNWDFEKDILSASRRFESLLASREISHFVHILLITQSKLEASKKASNKAGSNWRKLSEIALGYPVVILTWEDIKQCCEGNGGSIVSGFLKQHIQETRRSFRHRARELLALQ